ncbi:MAG: 3-deoxy-D-manno-octulosonic acid transferase [Alphaproteobacteria bacterium]|nr:3-deoxy-D-manno-octulosonic acid transferase [Alphaproteobacteria bacterium]MBO7097915.1 3-deoxy-D-manno-octulosonic acid transferase [Alphaproteobacteria bacterium]
MLLRLYKAVLAIMYPLALNRYIEKRKKNGKEDVARFHERLGKAVLPRPKGTLIWMHGASVGEAVSMLPLIKTLLQIYPDLHILVTTGTVTSADIMAKRLPDRAFHQYFPLEHPLYAARFIRHWKPNLVLWFESEFWPCMLSTIKKRNTPLILINGRISNKSFRRWQQFEFAIHPILDCFTLCLGQSDEDTRRLQALGAKNTASLGNLKYAGLPLPVDEKKKALLAEQLNNRPKWLVSSTHDDEESKIGRFLKDLEAKVPNLITVIVPRHPERGVEIKEKLAHDYGLKVALRSQNEPIEKETEVYVADTIGELGIFYELINIVFVGGSLISHGGQNFMEPSRYRDATIVGPHMFNFSDAMNRARKANAVMEVNDVLELMDIVQKLLTSPEFLEEKRTLAYNWATSEAKVLNGIVEKIKDYIK